MKAHRPQHRSESEESKRNKAFAELKRENQKLQREVARLNKEVERLSATSIREPDVWQKWAKKHLEDRKKGVLCSKCESADVKTLKMPTGTLKVCQFCGHKEKVGGRDAKAA